MRKPLAFLLAIKQQSLPQQCGMEMTKWLLARGCSCTCVGLGASEKPLDVAAFRNLACAADVVLVLGGDGSMLEVGRALCGLETPLAGVNFGRMGFLTEISPESWQQDLADMLAGVFQSQACSLLSWKLRTVPQAYLDESPEAWLDFLAQAPTLEAGCAVNDVVLARGSMARLVTIDVRIQGKLLTKVRCDGMILSTPLGSTGYTLSNHGPLLYPHLNTVVLSALAPYAASFPPMVLPGALLIHLSPAPGSETALTVDGQLHYCLEKNQVQSLEIAPGPNLSLFTRHQHWYFSRLNQRGIIPV